jgi:hypothetical protein
LIAHGATRFTADGPNASHREKKDADRADRQGKRGNGQHVRNRW